MARGFLPSARWSVGAGSLARLGALVWLGICEASCANLLGIEDARCDPGYAPDCTGQGVGGTTSGSILPLNAAGGNSGGSGGTSSGLGAGGSALGGGSAGTAAGTAGAAGSAGVPNASPLCQQYCDELAASCTGTNQQFISEIACLSVCALLDPGAPGDTSGNTVECRLSRARLADSTGEPGNYCFSAGPGGAGACGSNCDGFCTVMTQKCAELGDDAACLQACAKVPDLSQSSTKQNYNTSLQDGNSMQCRLFHVSAASVDPAMHCIHAAGLAVCE